MKILSYVYDCNSCLCRNRKFTQTQSYSNACLHLSILGTMATKDNYCYITEGSKGSHLYPNTISSTKFWHAKNLEQNFGEPKQIVHSTVGNVLFLLTPFAQVPSLWIVLVIIHTLNAFRVRPTFLQTFTIFLLSYSSPMPCTVVTVLRPFLCCILIWTNPSWDTPIPSLSLKASWNGSEQ